MCFAKRSMLNYSITVPRVLFDFNPKENYSAVDLCFHPSTTISIGFMVPNSFLFSVN